MAALCVSNLFIFLSYRQLFQLKLWTFPAVASIYFLTKHDASSTACLPVSQNTSGSTMHAHQMSVKLNESHFRVQIHPDTQLKVSDGELFTILHEHLIAAI